MDTVAPSATASKKPLTIEIDGTMARANSFAARSSKCSPGDMMETGRTDGAAPPTEATCPGTFTFADFIDTINPLQHIPVLSAAYRAVTGDTISPTSNVAGGMLYGGPFGGVLALAGSMFDILQGVDDDAAQATQVANAGGKVTGAALPAISQNA